jgi:hypothetical protein
MRKSSLKNCARFFNSSLFNDFNIFAIDKIPKILSNTSNYSNLTFNEVIAISTNTREKIVSKRFL